VEPPQHARGFPFGFFAINNNNNNDNNNNLSFCSRSTAVAIRSFSNFNTIAFYVRVTL